jgi:hypothetical protein
MPYLPVNTAFSRTIGGTTVVSKCEIDPTQVIEQIDWAPPRNGIASLRPEAPRAGGRRGVIQGVIFRIRGQEASGTPWQDADLARAAGMLPDAGPLYTYTLGDFHASTDTPAGDLVRGTSAFVAMDGIKYGVGAFVTNCRFNFVAGEFPTMAVDFEAQMLDADVTSTTASETTVSVPSITATLAGQAMPWEGSTIVCANAWNGPVEEIMVDLGNTLAFRKSGGGKVGYTAPDVTAAAPTCEILFERVPKATYALESAVIAGTPQTFTWTYVAGSGAVGNTLTYNVTGVPFRMPDRVNQRGNLCYRMGLTVSAFGWVHS